MCVSTYDDSLSSHSLMTQPLVCLHAELTVEDCIKYVCLDAEMG